MNTDRMGSRGNVNACVCVGGGGGGRVSAGRGGGVTRGMGVKLRVDEPRRTNNSVTRYMVVGNRLCYLYDVVRGGYVIVDVIDDQMTF